MTHLATFLKKIESKEALIGIVGLGYVGLPLAIAYADHGYRVLGLDIDPRKPEAIAAGRAYLKHIPGSRFAPHVAAGRLQATCDFARARECDAVLICVPTPLNESREPDTSFIEASARAILPGLHPGQLVSLESSTYPGTTDELVRAILEGGSPYRAGRDFFLVFSPEREDPGNPTFHTANIPKVVGGYTPDCLKAGEALYAAAVERVVPVSSTRAAEMVKLLENTFRAVNIALVNELKLICERMDLDVWEVIRAAATKPFGYQPFWPGPGLGGHCIPIDPFYLTWKARQYDLTTRFIELAGEINTNMPYHVVERAQDALNGKRKSLNGARVLVLGAAYKPDIDDMRESPALKIIELLREKGAQVEYHDPHVPALPPTRKHRLEMSSVPLDEARLKAADCVVVVTHHKAIDWQLVARAASLIVDSRNVVPRDHGNVVGA
ncbi:MAG TPA: nucleotide sugar dehydrogenase [Myxococcota bacterium]|nr:nucleotide sugar dehydrogenase [Myxococcota bacterium]HRY93128.1 nucleotide sugar dehydrogenase [Myxococcota bacterium]